MMTLPQDPKLTLFLVVVLFCIAPLARSVYAQEPSNARTLLQKYCVRCHNASEQEGDVRLDQISRDNFDLSRAIYEQLSSKQMPPGDETQPTAAERSQMANQFLQLAKKSEVPETAALRRLNKREYTNTVRDLLGLHKGIFDPGKLVYDDEVDKGFDTDGESLVTSNELLLEYLQAAQISLRQALFTLDPKPPEPRVINVKMSRMTGASNRYETKSSQAYVFRVGRSKIHDSSAKKLIDQPGRYRITITASAVDKEHYPVPFAPVDAPPILGIGSVSGDRSTLSEFDQHEERFPLVYGKEQTFQVERWIDRGFHPYLHFANGSRKPITQIRSNLRRGKLSKKDANGPFRGPGIRITQFKIEGPFFDKWPPDSVRVTIGSNEIPNLEDENERLMLLGRFAKRAFRRSVTRQEMALWTEYLNTRYAVTNDWRVAIVETMTAMMASPDFLYLQEDEGDLNSHQLASRLSYLFWSTMPDGELVSLADSGKLADPEVLRKQVARLIQDPRSQRFCDSFVDQWLALDTLGTMPPDSKMKEFRVYKPELENAMRQETEQFFRYVFQQNRSVQELIDSEYTFLNGPLAKLYGVPFEEGDDGKLQLTKLPKQSGRGGILGQASVLTLTSNGVETSAVTRGVWVLEHFLGTPPPPPPKEVPALVPDLNGAQTVRQLLEKHRSDTACMKCHRRMDPLGFALESFDPIGRFRTKYAPRQKVSTSGKFMGQEFDDIVGLKKILATDVRPFARNLIVQIAEYAKGRKLVASDYPVVEAILAAAEKQEYKLKHIVYQIAVSDLMTRR